MGGRASKEAIRRAVRKHHEKHRSQQNAKTHAYHLANKDKIAIRQKAKRNSPKGRAGAKLRYAVWAGKIDKPDTCEDCKTQFENKGKIHGHHHDYSRPFDVQWLCSICHGKAHRI